MLLTFLMEMRASEYCLRRFLNNHGNIMTEGSLKSYRMTSRVLYSAQYHSQHCTLQDSWSTVYAQPR